MNSVCADEKLLCFVCNGRRGPWRSFAEKESPHSGSGLASLLRKILFECTETAQLLASLQASSPSPTHLLCGSCFRLILEADKLQVDLDKTKQSICVRFCTRNGPVSSNEDLSVGDNQVEKKSEDISSLKGGNRRSVAKKPKNTSKSRAQNVKKRESTKKSAEAAPLLPQKDAVPSQDAEVLPSPSFVGSREGSERSTANAASQKTVITESSEAEFGVSDVQNQAAVRCVADPSSAEGEFHAQQQFDDETSDLDNFSFGGDLLDDEDSNSLFGDHDDDPDFMVSNDADLKSRDPLFSLDSTQKRQKRPKSDVTHRSSSKHTKGESQVCEECGLSGTHEMLELHRNLVHGAKSGSFPCELCPVMLRSQQALDSHMKRNHSSQETEKVFVCEHCGRKCRTEYERKHHQDVVHAGECKYPCSECGEKFRYKPVLRNHLLKVHGIDKRSGLPCNVCGKMFYGAWKSQMFTFHMKDAHQIEVPALKTWRCQTCGKEFQFKSRLLNHERLHTGEKPHTCAQCGKTFRLQQKLSIHMSRMHSGKQKPARVPKKSGKPVNRLVIGGDQGPSPKQSPTVENLLANNVISTSVGGHIVVEMKKEDEMMMEHPVHLQHHHQLHHVVTGLDGNLVLSGVSHEDIQHLQDLHHIVVQPVEDEAPTDDQNYMMEIKEESASSIPVTVANCVGLSDTNVVVTQDVNGKRISLSKAIWKQIPLLNGTSSMVVLKMDGTPVDGSVTLYSDFEGTGELSDGSTLHYEI